MAPKRTVFRKPKNYLKVWSPVSAPDWTKSLTPRLHVGRVDEHLPVGKEGTRKSWYLLLTQRPNLLATLGPVQGAPDEGTSLLLFEDDVVALCRYLLESELVVLTQTDVVNGPVAEFDMRTPPRAVKPRRQRRAGRAKRR